MYHSKASPAIASTLQAAMRARKTDRDLNRAAPRIEREEITSLSAIVRLEIV